MDNSKLGKVLKAVAHKFIIIYLAVFLAMPVQAVERIRYIHTDALGSPSAATDENSEVVWREYYRPYGERIMDATDDNRIWFTGKIEQSNIGLNYHGARWYDPMVGRFTGNDPAGVDPTDFNTFNRYCYANNNPYAYTDPNGEAAAVLFAVGGLILLSFIVVSDRMRSSTTFPAQDRGSWSTNSPVHQGGYDKYDGRISDPPSWWSTTSSPTQEWNAPTWVSSETTDAEEGPALSDGDWHKDAPHFVEPGTGSINHQKYNPRTGQLEESTVEYDEYGRQIKRTDYTDHGYADDHTSPHTHTYEYGPGYAPKGKETRTNQ